MIFGAVQGSYLCPNSYTNDIKINVNLLLWTSVGVGVGLVILEGNLDNRKAFWLKHMGQARSKGNSMFKLIVYRILGKNIALETLPRDTV